MSNIIFAVIIFFFSVSGINCFIEGIYCGKENCYEVLGIQRDASKPEIVKAYRQLARKYHPDMHKTQEAKEKATKRFTLIATASEVLRDEDTRRDYDYMLDNPDELYHHYFSYYRRRMTPQVDVRLVVAVTITIISVIQYWGAWNRYNEAINIFSTIPKYRIKAQELAKQEGLFPNPKGKGRRSKEVIKEEEEQILKKIIAENIDIRGGFSRPSLRNVLWLQLVLFPYTVCKWIYFYGRWFWKFSICNCPYGTEEKEYLVRRWLKLSQNQWESLEDTYREEFMSKKCWIWENFQAHKAEKEAKMKAKLAENGRYKSYRRHMKNHGPGQLSFDE